MEMLSVVQKQIFIVPGLVTAIALVLFGLKGYEEERSGGVFTLLDQPLLTYSLQQVKEETNQPGGPGKDKVVNLGFTSASDLPQASLSEAPMHYK